MMRANHFIHALLILTGVAVALSGWSFAMCLITGDLWYMSSVFAAVSGAFLVTAALFELLLIVPVYLRFSSDQHLHKAWFLIMSAAGCRVIGLAIAHVGASNSELSPFHGRLFQASGISATAVRDAGIVFSSPLAFALLAVGLWYVLQAYDSIGWSASLDWTDYIILSIMMAQCVNHFTLIYVNVTTAPETIDLFRVLNWTSEPLLLWLMLLACRLRRSAGRMGGGWVARCWQSYSLAVLLTCLGDVGIWAVAYDHVKWPLSFLTYFIWIPAAAAFALAPAFQFAAIGQLSRNLLPDHNTRPAGARVH